MLRRIPISFIYPDIINRLISNFASFLFIYGRHILIFDLKYERGEIMGVDVTPTHYPNANEELRLNIDLDMNI